MRKVLVLLAFGWVLGSPAAASDPPYTGPALHADYEGPILVDNSQYRYTGEDRLSFSTAEYLATTYPDLLPLRPAIDTWASRLGIHPQVLSPVAYSYFVGSTVLGDQRDIKGVVQVASALATVFDSQAMDPLAASRAVKATADALFFELQLPAGLAESRREALPAAAVSPLFGYFQPPWEIGDTWAGGGAHGSSSNALDFWGVYQVWGADTSPYWVAAMQSGTVRVWSSCSLSITHDNGWVTDYYHLENIQVADFATVQRNDRLSNYADDLSQALCQGGSSSGPHVHMSLYFGGQGVSVDELQIDFTAFSHHVGVGSYDSNCNTSWYTHFTGGKICPNYDSLLNNAPPPTAIFDDDFESGDTFAWSATMP